MKPSIGNGGRHDPAATVCGSRRRPKASPAGSRVNATVAISTRGADEPYDEKTPEEAAARREVPADRSDGVGGFTPMGIVPSRWPPAPSGSVFSKTRKLRRRRRRGWPCLAVLLEPQQRAVLERLRLVWRRRRWSRWTDRMCPVSAKRAT